MQASAASTPVGQQLSDDLLAVIRTVMRAGGGRFLTVIEEHGISMTAMKLLMTLDAADSDLPVSKVAASLGLSLAATSRAVADAVKRGFV
nr:helix-turn-helix domain-containing protein [Baekduia sp.]